jgi:hypothetical protein
MTKIGLRSMRENDRAYVVFLDVEAEKSAWINLADFQALWRTLRDVEVPQGSKIVFKEPSEKYQSSKCASLENEDTFKIYEAEGRIDKNTKFSDITTFDLSDDNVKLLDAIADKLTPVDEFDKALQNLQKRSKIRIV